MHSPLQLKPRPLTVIRRIVSSVVRRGDFVIDATIGNGNDTELLAQLVGRKGLVLGFDVQQSALDATVARLSRAGVEDRVRLVLEGHERMSEVVTSMKLQRRARCVMFNLGYQPGGDKRLVTKPDTTVKAIRAAAEVLMMGGLITVVVYPNHPGGAEEASAVFRLLDELQMNDGFSVQCYGYAAFISDSEPLDLNL